MFVYKVHYRFNGKKGHFTGTLLHTSGAEAELLVGIRFGLIRHRVVDGGSGAVVLTRTAVIKMPTGLRERQRGDNRTLSFRSYTLKCTCERKHTPDSRSLLGRCSLRHTARDSSHSRRDLYSAYSLMYNARWSLKTHKHTCGQAAESPSLLFKLQQSFSRNPRGAQTSVKLLYQFPTCSHKGLDRFPIRQTCCISTFVMSLLNFTTLLDFKMYDIIKCRRPVKPKRCVL